MPPPNGRKENKLWREIFNMGLSKTLQKMGQDLGQLQEPFLVRRTNSCSSINLHFLCLLWPCIVTEQKDRHTEEGIFLNVM